MAEKRADRRVLRTKKLLRQGLTQLMEQKSIKKITVRELSALADINRGTFYLHYRDIYDLVEHIENELLEEFESILLRYTIEEVSAKPNRVIADVCAFLSKNRGICSALLGDNGDINFSQKLRAFVRSRYLQEFSKSYRLRDRGDCELLYAFFEGGFAGALRYWLSRPEDGKTPEEVAEFVSMIFTHGVSACIRQKDTAQRGQ